MGRFDWLELPKEGQPAPAPGEPDAAVVEKFDADYYLQLAARVFDEGSFEEALRYYSRALHLDRQLPIAWGGQVKCLIEMHEVAEAKTWTEKGLTQHLNDPDLLSSKGVLLAKSGRCEEAMACSDRALSRPGQSVYPWLARGEILLLAGTPTVAEHCFAKALESCPNDWRTLSQIGRIYLRNGRYADAAEHFNRAVEGQPANAALWTKLGQAFDGLRLFSRARSCFEKALQFHPGDREAAEGLIKDSERSPGLIGRWIERLTQLFTVS